MMVLKKKKLLYCTEYFEEQKKYFACKMYVIYNNLYGWKITSSPH